MPAPAVFAWLTLWPAASAGAPIIDGGAASPPPESVPPATAAPVPEAPTATTYPTAAAALQAVLARAPRVVAVGELHQTKATARVPSALVRFTRELLAPLRAAGATDLVVETWIATGACGEVEKQAVAQVDRTTQRPAHTENEVLALLRQAKRAGMEPRILEIACRDYQAMMGARALDPAELLRLTRAQLEKQIQKALARPGSGMVVSYGGALHNDLRPAPELAPYSFGPAVSRAVGGRYLELDLYVPEFMDQYQAVRAEPWFQAYRRAHRPGRVTLVRRGDSSYALVFPRSR